MKRETYKSLLTMQFLNSEGGIISYWSKPDQERYYKYEDVSAILYEQLSETIDYNNIIILFPTNGNFGGTGFYGPGNNINDPRKVLIDHCTYTLDVFSILDKHGVKFKNGAALTDSKYAQMRMSMIVVHNGIAYVIDSTANPLSTGLTYNKAATWETNPEFNHAAIKLNDDDVKSGVLLIDKHIMFSGFFIRNSNESAAITDNKDNPAKKIMDNRNKRQENMREVAQTVFNARFDDEGGIDNYALGEFFEQYASITFPKFEEWFNKVWDLQKSDSEDYGDIDFTCERLYDGPYAVTNKEKEWNVSFHATMKKLGHIGTDMPEEKQPDTFAKVMLIDDHSSSAEHTKFIIIQERKNIFAHNPEKFKMDAIKLAENDMFTYHVRIVWDDADSDYTTNGYTSRPNLQWYKDRNYDIRYNEDLHMTPLGGSYADCRDDGFVITAKKDKNDNFWSIEKGVRHRFHMYEFVCGNLASAVYELEELDE